MAGRMAGQYGTSDKHEEDTEPVQPGKLVEEAGTSGVSVHIFERTTANYCKSRESIFFSEIESLKNCSLFRDDFKKLKYSRGP
jgi:hypothetical protein